MSGALHLVVVTGLSGSGKSTAIKVLEDLGFYCIDNLPAALIPRFVELWESSQEEVRRVALGLDVREDAPEVGGEPLGLARREVEPREPRDVPHQGFRHLHARDRTGRQAVRATTSPNPTPPGRRIRILATITGTTA